MFCVHVCDEPHSCLWHCRVNDGASDILRGLIRFMKTLLIYQSICMSNPMYIAFIITFCFVAIYMYVVVELYYNYFVLIVILIYWDDYLECMFFLMDVVMETGIILSLLTLGAHAQRGLQ